MANVLRLMIFAIDLEGVLAPEIWPILGARFEIPDLSLTTRDMADFSELMHVRVRALQARGLALRELQTIAHAVEPYLGAPDLIARLRRMGNVVIISDTFHELSDPLAVKLGGVNLFANRFELDAAGHINGFKLRIRGQKERIVSGFRSAGFAVSAMGDSMNDLSLLRACDYPVLYRPVDLLRTEFPDAPIAHDLDTALALFEAACRHLEENGG
jgi:phosphoserine/homoserine phosphotransferase